MTWTNLDLSSQNGGSAITSYNLEWDAGTNKGTWTSLEGLSSSYTGLFFIKTTGVVQGTRYYFRLQA